MCDLCDIRERTAEDSLDPNQNTVDWMDCAVAEMKVVLVIVALKPNAYVMRWVYLDVCSAAVFCMRHAYRGSSLTAA